MPEATSPLPRSPSTMRHGWLLRGELQRLAASRRERGEPIDWTQWCYIAAATLDAIRPGRDRIVMMASGCPYAGRYFRTWAECLPQNLLCEGRNRLALTLEEVPDDILRAAEAACKTVGKRRHRTFLKGSTIGRLLGVTSPERQRLGLRIIIAMDDDISIKRAAVERKRERDRLRDERKRRAAGAKPRGETIAEQAKKLGISRAALVKRRQRESQNVHTSSPLDEAENVHNSSPLHEPSKMIENQSDSAIEATHVHSSSRDKYYVVVSSVTPAQPSEEPQDRASGQAAITKDAPSGEDRDRTTKPNRRTPSSAILPPPKPVMINGYPPEVFYLISLSAHEAATEVRRRSDFRNPESVTAAITSVIRAEDRAFIRAMETNGLDTDDAWHARGYLDRRICQIVQADRADAH